MTYQAFEETGTGIVEVENFLDPRVSLGFRQHWGFSQSEAEELDTKLVIARDLPTNKDCVKQEPDVYLLRLVGLSGQGMGTFGVYGNLWVWKLYLCVERILLIPSHLFSLTKGEFLLPRTEKYVSAYFRERRRGTFMDLNVIFHPQDHCKWCMRASERVAWECQDVQIQLPTRCPCGMVTDGYRPWRSWAHLTNRLALHHQWALTRHLDPIDQRSLTSMVW